MKILRLKNDDLGRAGEDGKVGPVLSEVATPVQYAICTHNHAPQFPRDYGSNLRVNIEWGRCEES